MSNVVRLLQDRAFDPETIKLLVHAYDKACAELTDTGQPHTVKEVIAKRIINLAESGERDPVQLVEHALLGLRSTHPAQSRRT